MQLPIFLAENQILYVGLVVFLLCVILMIFEETFTPYQACWQIKKGVPYKKIFLYMSYLIVTCVLSLLFDLRFVQNSDNVICKMFFAICLIIFVVGLVFVSKYWQDKIRLKPSGWSSFATASALILTIFCAGSTYSGLSVAYVLRELLFIVIPVFIGSATILVCLMWWILQED